MAKNNHDWHGATPFNADASIPHSGLDSFAAPTPNADRKFSGPTPYGHSKPTKKSGGDGIGMPTGINKSAPTPLAHGNGSTGPVVPHAGPKPKSGDMTSWKKKGYSTDVPTTLGGGHMRKSRRNIEG